MNKSSVSGQSSVANAPAPWHLTGDAYVVVLYLPKAMDDAKKFTPETLKDRSTGRIATLMFVNYHSSNVGPYHELLFIPGQFSFKGKNRWSITKIYVDSLDSVVNGTINWGIPKEQAEFKVEKSNDVLTIQVSKSGYVFAELQFKEK